MVCQEAGTADEEWEKIQTKIITTARILFQRAKNLEYRIRRWEEMKAGDALAVSQRVELHVAGLDLAFHMKLGASLLWLNHNDIS